MEGRHLNATTRTLLLAASLVLIAAGLLIQVPAGPLLDSTVAGRPAAQVAILAVLFCLAEFGLLHVEVRRQAYSITLATVPLALGLLLCGPRELVAARVAGSLVAFLIQRSPPLKIGYNLAAYAAEAAIDASLVHAVLGHPGTLTVTVAGVCLLVIALTDQLMSFLVVVIITWHQGALTRREGAAVMLPASRPSLMFFMSAMSQLSISSYSGPIGRRQIFSCVRSAALASWSHRASSLENNPARSEPSAMMIAPVRVARSMTNFGLNFCCV